MGKMKTLGEDLKEKLEAYANAQQMHMYGGQGNNQRSTTISNMRGVDDPNQREAYAIPLSRLVDMWRVKFGDLWVDVSEIDDQFWADASGRLHRNKLMEEVEFHASNTPWARLKEDA